MTTAEMQPITDWHRALRDADFYTARSVDEALRLASEHAGGASSPVAPPWCG